MATPVIKSHIQKHYLNWQGAGHPPRMEAVQTNACTIQFPHLQEKDTTACFSGQLDRLKKIMCAQYLAPWLEHSRYSVNNSCYDNYCILLRFHISLLYLLTFSYWLHFSKNISLKSVKSMVLPSYLWGVWELLCGDFKQFKLLAISKISP